MTELLAVLGRVAEAVLDGRLSQQNLDALLGMVDHDRHDTPATASGSSGESRGDVAA